MKYYKVTVLKDLPNFCSGESYGKIPERVVEARHYCRVERDGKDIQELIVLSKENPDFVKLEIDKSCAVSTICPKCGGSKMFPTDTHSSRCDDGVRYHYSTISLICAECGTEAEIYKYLTRSEVYSW